MANLALALTLLLALSEEDSRWLGEDSVPPAPARHPWAEALNARGIATFRQAALEEPGGNLILSPFALSLSRDSLGPFHAATVAHLRDTTRELFVRIGERRWERNPDSLALDAWAFKASGAALKSLGLPAGRPDAAGLRSHVLYIQGYWLALREQSRRGFRRPDGTLLQVPMLVFEEPYLHVDSVRILQLPFAENRYSLVVVLPDSGFGLDRVIDRLAEEDWRIWMGLRPMIRGRGAFPELRLQHIGTLRAPRPPIRYGIRLTVGKDKHKVIPPRIERVIQSARSFPWKPRVINLEEGALPFDVDRPFLFAIRDTRTGVLLMLGRVTDPSASPEAP